MRRLHRLLLLDELEQKLFAILHHAGVDLVAGMQRGQVEPLGNGETHGHRAHDILYRFVLNNDHALLRIDAHDLALEGMTRVGTAILFTGSAALMFVVGRGGGIADAAGTTVGGGAGYGKRETANQGGE